MKKTRAPQPEVDSDTDLPEGWTLASTADLFTFVTSGSRGWAKYYTEDGALFLRIANLDHDTIAIDFSEKKFVQPPPSSEGTRTRVQIRDLLISITADVGMIGLVTEDLGEAYINQHIALARPFQWLDDRFLAWYITSRQGQEQFRELQRGATKVGLGLDDIQSIDVPLAPIDEQHRIVRELEKLFGQVHHCCARLACVPRILQQFRQSVLAAACSGRLTEDWRKTNPDVLSVSDLLVVMYRERGESYLARRREADVSGKRNLLKPKNLAPSDHAAESMFELPDNWLWLLFDSVCEDITVGHVGPMAHEYVEEGIPFLRSQNVREFRLDPTGLKFISQKFHEKLSKSALHPGDIAIVRSGYPGVACVIPTSLPIANCSDLVIVRPSRILDPRYAVIFINSSSAKAHVQSEKVGIAQAHFNIGAMRETPLPLPPLEEQHEIVRRVEALFKLADAIEKRVEAATKRADKLTQSILAKAFRGELVPTEAELARKEGRTYEPASELLARIKSEREKSTAAKTTSANRKSHPTAVARR